MRDDLVVQVLGDFEHGTRIRGSDDRQAGLRSREPDPEAVAEVRKGTRRLGGGR
ncbi:hypothetical protein GCM10009654_37810 [Streptomyces hebeiensis]|uniref:Uncharacterized protein n=1 Tax=Streptomyces hebeiensis TaxID=229486 RepID=A0ABN1UWV4_9ACTN